MRRLIEAASKEPVLLLDEGERAAVVLSPEEFERLDEADRVRGQAKVRLRETIAAIQAEAAERGLTERNSIGFWPIEVKRPMSFRLPLPAVGASTLH